ncbi:MAG TPA: hypothetical protein VHL53_11215 [Acidimicrobiia bacterium]|nr:hypothetical protein [Acidimicrobiia bacterium]
MQARGWQAVRSAWLIVADHAITGAERAAARDAAGELRTLTATGASGTFRRNLTAATAGTLAALGTALGIGGTYVVLLGAYSNRLGDLRSIPFASLFTLAVGVPPLAAAAAWLLAGKEPPALARPAFE